MSVTKKSIAALLLTAMMAAAGAVAASVTIAAGDAHAAGNNLSELAIDGD